MTEKEKMLAGKLYDASDAELSALRRAAHALCLRYNQLSEENTQERREILERLAPKNGNGFYIQGPLAMDYGCFTTFGDGFYANFNLTILDCAPVEIGKNVMLGPNVSLLTPMHPLCWSERNPTRGKDGAFHSLEYAKPIKIGDNCWIAGNVTICGGTVIGSGCVIGAGSVVTRSIPDGYLAAGNPCRPIRPITEDDLMGIDGRNR